MYKEIMETFASNAGRCFKQMTGLPVIGWTFKEQDTFSEKPLSSISVTFSTLGRAVSSRIVADFMDREIALEAASAISSKLEMGKIETWNETVRDLVGEYLNATVKMVISDLKAKRDDLRFDEDILDNLSPDTIQCAYPDSIKTYAVTISLPFSKAIIRVSWYETINPIFKHRKIMVVDDTGVVRAYIARVLRKLGAVVEEATDGVEAVEKHEFFQPELTIMDLIMPRMTGLEAIEAIIKTVPEAQFIVLTSVSDKRHVFQARKLGVNDYLLKPPQEEKIIDRVCRSLGLDG